MKTDPVANPAVNREFKPTVQIRPITPADSLRDFNDAIEEARKLQRQADALIPQLLRMVKGRLHLVNAKGMHSSPHHQLLMDLKKELANYNGQSARWEK